MFPHPDLVVHNGQNGTVVWYLEMDPNGGYNDNKWSEEGQNPDPNADLHKDVHLNLQLIQNIAAELKTATGQRKTSCLDKYTGTRT